MSVDDYVGRTVDLVAMGGVSPTGKVLLRQSLAAPGEAGEICTGIQMLVQRFLIELLTEAGSMPYAPSRGTRLMTLLNQGQVRTQLDAIQAMQGALVDLQQNLWSEESSLDPDDERYDSATLLTVELTSAGIKYTLQVSSRAGTARKVILPLAVTVGKVVSLP